MLSQLDLNPKLHWSKPFFQQHNIPINAIARYLDLSFHHVSNMLSGVTRVTPINEEKLRQLVELIKKSE